MREENNLQGTGAWFNRRLLRYTITILRGCREIQQINFDKKTHRQKC